MSLPVGMLEAVMTRKDHILDALKEMAHNPKCSSLEDLQCIIACGCRRQSFNILPTKERPYRSVTHNLQLEYGDAGHSRKSNEPHTRSESNQDQIVYLMDSELRLKMFKSKQRSTRAASHKLQQGASFLWFQFSDNLYK